MAKAKNPSLYRALRHLRAGGLHRALNVPEGTPIPHSKLESALRSSNEHIRKMASFAKTMSGFSHSKK